MTEAGARRIAPSSKLALYLGALLAAYIVREPVAAIAFGIVVVAVALVAIARASRPVPAIRWRAVLVFVAWVFVMRAALDVVVGASLRDRSVWLTAGAQAIRIAVLGVGMIALVAATSARDVVEELEHSRLPRSLRLLVMMLVQYPRVLRDRYEQIVEAQVARGADRPRSVVQRVTHGASLLLPVMQSELNAVGERASLVHLRGLDVEVSVAGSRRGAADWLTVGVALLVIAFAVLLRVRT
jgi:energy-coupling factor transporter transmembrane protein EcfT